MATDFLDTVGDPGFGTESGAHGAPIASGIFRCQVIEVNAKDFTVTARTENQPFSVFQDIPFMVPYCHQTMGEGINFLPEPGSTCLVATPSDGKSAIVIGWCMSDEKGGYRGGRESLNPGDYYFSTRDGNFIAIRRGGIVQVGSTPLAQRIFIPLRNQVQDIFENYDLLGIPGRLKWEVFREEENGDGHKRCLLTIQAREFADDPSTNPLIELKMGSTGDGEPVSLSLVTRDSGGGEVTTSLTITKDGVVSWTTKELNWSGESVLFHASGEILLKSTGNLRLESESAVSVSAPNFSISAGPTSVNFGGSRGSISGPLDLGRGEAPVMIYTPEMIRWMTQVSAICTSGVPQPTNPPTNPASKDVKA